MKAEWLTLNEMEHAIATGKFVDLNGNPYFMRGHLAKQIAKVIADASKAKADSLA